MKKDTLAKLRQWPRGSRPKVPMITIIVSAGGLSAPPTLRCARRALIPKSAASNEGGRGQRLHVYVYTILLPTND